MRRRAVVLVVEAARALQLAHGVAVIHDARTCRRRAVVLVVETARAVQLAHGVALAVEVVEEAGALCAHVGAGEDFTALQLGRHGQRVLQLQIDERRQEDGRVRHLRVRAARRAVRVLAMSQLIGQYHLALAANHHLSPIRSHHVHPFTGMHKICF